MCISTTIPFIYTLCIYVLYIYVVKIVLIKLMGRNVFTIYMLSDHDVHFKCLTILVVIMHQ